MRFSDGTHCGNGVLFDALCPLDDACLGWLRRHVTARDRLLEVGCGSGRIALRLASSGTAVTGLDHDPEMLAEAERQQRRLGYRTLSWHLQDMRDFRLPEAGFPLALLSRNTLGFLADPLARLGCLRAIARHLAPAGRLLILLDNPARYVRQGYRVIRRRRGVLPDGREVTLHEERSLDLVLWQRCGTDTYEIAGPAGPGRCAVPVRHGIVTRDEVRLAAHLAGFTLVAERGDYEDGPLTARSSVAVYLLARCGGDAA